MFFIFLISVTLFYIETVLLYFYSITESNLNYSTQYEKCFFCRMKYFLQESSLLFPLLYSSFLSVILSLSLSFFPCLSHSLLHSLPHSLPVSLSISLYLFLSLSLTLSFSLPHLFFSDCLPFYFSPSSVFPLPFCFLCRIYFSVLIHLFVFHSFPLFLFLSYGLDA